MTIEEIISNISLYSGIAQDSRKVEPGFIYVAVKGLKFNGEDFIADALLQGAKVIVAESCPTGITAEKFVQVPNARAALAHLAAAMYPKHPDNIVAVTGTNGKTSVAFFCKYIVEYLGEKSASLGTLGLLSRHLSYKTSGILNSLEAVEFHQVLSALKEHDINFLAMEASSGGLHQNRMDGIRFSAIAFTNLTQDHLDYHGTMEAYLDAKLHAFDLLQQNGSAVVNADIPEYSTITKHIRPDVRLISFGQNAADLKLISFEHGRLQFNAFGKSYDVELNLNGHFQAYNVLAAIGLVYATGFSIDDIVKVLPKLHAAPGRLEYVGSYNQAKIFVDYAHSPDALEKALLNLKKECRGKLYVVFGCGGNRDKEKRPIMGEIAAHIADHVYVTDDNPRFEDPATIRKEVMLGCPDAFNIGDRSDCILQGVSKLQENDILLVAGKGHETYQVVGDEKVFFSDNEEVMHAINQLEKK